MFGLRAKRRETDELSRQQSRALEEIAMEKLRVAHQAAESAGLSKDGESVSQVFSTSFNASIQQSVNLSELLCLMAWSNGNARKLSGEAVAISSAVEEMARSVQSIAELSEGAQAQSSEARDLVQNGVQRSQSAGKAMDEISQAFGGLDSRMSDLGKAIESIGSFAKEIESISGQTKLLALNATIEAARAGEAGRGFAVVAAEVKSLSEETSKTTELIRGQLGTLTGVMQGMLHAMQIGSSKVSDGQATFRAVVGDMVGIRTCMDSVNSGIDSITAMLRDQHSASNSIAKNLVEIARLATQNEADTNSSTDYIRKTSSLVTENLRKAESHVGRGYAERRIRADLMNWKCELAECLVGIVKLDPQTYARHSRPFGESFDGIQDPGTLSHDAHAQLRRLLDQLNRDAGRMVMEVAAGSIDKAVPHYIAVDEAVKVALQHLDRLERDLRFT